MLEAERRDLVPPVPSSHTTGNGSSPAAFAIVYTVKNEAALLPAAIAFHAAAGCARFYVFWDGTTDDAPARLQGRADVIAQNSVGPECIADARTLGIDPERWADDMLVRKRVNAAYAARLAVRDGIGWLLSIDPDELVLADPRDAACTDGSVGRIDRMLAAVADEVDQVLIPNIEVQATTAAVASPFADCTLFLARRPRARAVWRASRLVLLRLLRSQRLAGWFDYGFFRLVSAGRFPPRMRHPVTGRTIPRSLYLGYHSYKAFIRSDRAPRFGFAIHRWTGPAGNRPRTVRRGLLLHYDLFSAEAFAAKFRQRPPRSANPHAVRSILARFARDLDDESIRRFFDRNIAISDPATIAGLVASGVAVDIRGPSTFFGQRAG